MRSITLLRVEAMIIHFLRRDRPFFLFAVAAIALGTSACNAASEATSEANGQPSPQSRNSQTINLTLNGAGASFPAPLYQTWFSELRQDYPGLTVNYQSIGSGAGIAQYLSGTVDFGATDAPLNDEERQSFIDRYGAEPIQVPTAGGLVTLAYNLPGIEALQLTQAAYCGIVTGEITQWDAEPIASANPGLALPSQSITVVHRSDGSGTTFLFTNHLSEVCPTWSNGAAKTVAWPVGVGAKGNEGISAQVQQTEGAIGYVEYTYAAENDIAVATLENSAGNFVVPSPEAAARAFEEVDPPEDFALLLPNPQGEQAYPIVGLTWLLLYPRYDERQTADAVHSLVAWTQTKGAQSASALGYIPLADEVSERVKRAVKQGVRAK